ncbi:MAG: heme ABC exporter ATP-binding protein CcmA [Lachnospiraceae bacterium]
MLEVTQIKKTYGKKEILKDITFAANCGERIAIIGKNGCGKSTLLQILTGIIKADSGEIRFFGKNPNQKRSYFHKFCGYVPQENPLMEELTVKDNLYLWGADRSDYYEKLLETFELQNILKMPVHQLSGGMKRRLSIACALAEWPPILFLDEPTTALDLHYKESIAQWMQTYQDMNGILVLTTHDIQEISACDRCLYMKDGVLRELSQREREPGQLHMLFA